MNLAYVGFGTDNDNDLVPVLMDLDNDKTVELYFAADVSLVKTLEIFDLQPDMRPVPIPYIGTYGLATYVSKHLETMRDAMMILNTEKAPVFFIDEDGDKDSYYKIFRIENGKAVGVDVTTDLAEIDEDCPEFEDLHDEMFEYQGRTVTEMVSTCVKFRENGEEREDGELLRMADAGEIPTYE